MKPAVDTTRLAEHAPIRDIAATRTLPARYYTDPAVLEAERSELFFRTWQYACHRSELGEPGAYLTMQIFDQEIVLTCGRDGEIRAFYNVCIHRGHKLIEGAGQASRLTCPYHAWTYALDGRLVGVRRGEGTTEVAKSEICLTAIRVDFLLDFVFVNLDPEATPLADMTEGLAQAIEAAIPGVRAFRPVRDLPRGDVPMRCNWKLIIDNYLECYHCETAHLDFCDMFRAGEVSHSFATYHMHQHLPSAGKAKTRAYNLDLETDLLDGNFWYVFPNTTIGQLPGTPSLTVSRIVPLGPEMSERRFTSVEAPGADRARVAERLDFLRTGVGAEDVALCEGVQIGMRQRAFNQGLYMIDPVEETYTEEGVRFFHRLYADVLEPSLAALR